MPILPTADSLPFQRALRLRSVFYEFDGSISGRMTSLIFRDFVSGYEAYFHFAFFLTYLTIQLESVHIRHSNINQCKMVPSTIEIF